MCKISVQFVFFSLILMYFSQNFAKLVEFVKFFRDLRTFVKFRETSTEKGVYTWSMFPLPSIGFDRADSRSELKRFWLRSIQKLKDPFADALGGVPPGLFGMLDRELEQSKPALALTSS